MTLRDEDELITQGRCRGVDDRSIDHAAIASGAATVAEGIRQARHCGAPHIYFDIERFDFEYIIGNGECPSGIPGL